MTDKEPTLKQLEDNLSQEQKDFCDYYLTPNEFYGNGVMSYLEAYGPSYLAKYKKPMEYKTAGVLAHELLKTPKIFNYINARLETGGFNNENVDKQHLFLINQQADLRTKMAAIDSFNKLKKRIDNKMELILPKPILDAVSSNNSNKEDSILNKED